MIHNYVGAFYEVKGTDSVHRKPAAKQGQLFDHSGNVTVLALFLLFYTNWSLRNNCNIYLVEKPDCVLSNELITFYSNFNNLDFNGFVSF